MSAPRFDDFKVFNFTILNDSDYSKTWTILDRISGNSILETFFTYRMIIKGVKSLTAPALLNLTMQTDATLSGIQAANNILTVTILSADLKNLPSLVYYELHAIYPDGIDIVYVLGQINNTRN